MTTEQMPKRHTGVYSRTGSNVWQWKIRAPKDLRHAYPSEWAHRCSLGTSNLQEANQKAIQLHAEWVRRFDEQRKALNPQRVERVTSDLAKLIAQKALHDTLNREDVRLDRSWRSSMLTWHRSVGLVGMQGYAQRLGIIFDEGTPGAREGLHHYLHALEESLKAKLVEQPPAPAEKAAEELKPRVLREVFERWKAARDSNSDGVKACERALKLYEQHTGSPPIKKLTRAQGDGFRAWLQTLGTASKTAHDRLTYVKSLLGYAYRDLEWLNRNPWEGLDIEHRTEQRRTPWTAEQVQAFFSLSLFQQYELPLKRWQAGKDAAYWIPLLGLYTGARLGELCQLRVADVVTKDGQAFISINDEAEGAKVKTEAGLREVPLHSELERLGFLEYVKAIGKPGNDRLWPALKFRNGKPGGYFSAWFSEARALVKSCEIPDFHSLRHTVRTAMAEAGFDESIQDRITGHKIKGSVGTRVYSHPTAILRRAVEAITYPGLILPKVYQAAMPPIEI